MIRKISSRLARLLGIGLAAIFLFIGLTWLYTVIVIRLAIAQGAYASPEEGMLARTLPYFENIEKSEIVYAGPNSFDGSQPHVWYVILRVWAEKTRDGRPVGFQGKDYESPGHFYLHTKQGWVQISEGLFPMYLGFWMDIFGMAGRGSPTPTVDGTNW